MPKRSNRTGHPTCTLGRYRGVDFIVQRLGDIFPYYFDNGLPDAREWRVFEYGKHEVTGDHFRTVAEFQLHIDKRLDE